LKQTLIDDRGELQTTTPTDDRRRQTPPTVTSLATLHYVLAGE